MFFSLTKEVFVMRLVSFVAIGVAAVASCTTQKTFAPPAPSVQPRLGMLSGTTVALAIYDARPDTSQFSAIAQSIADAVRLAYPSARLALVPRDSAHADAAPGVVTVRVAVAAYVADFGRKVTAGIGSVGGTFVVGAIPEGVWNGLAGVVVTVVDRRTVSSSTKTQSISKLVSKPNTFGYKTARAALADSFHQSIADLLLFVDASLAR